MAASLTDAAARVAPVASHTPEPNLSPLFKLIVVVLATLMVLSIVGFAVLAIWEPSPTVTRVERVIPRDRQAR